MNEEQNNLKNKVVVVAGGAGEIGESITKSFLAEGAVVIVPSRSAEKINALKAAVEKAKAEQLVAVNVDVNTPVGLNELVRVIKNHGHVRVAVSALGSYWQGPSSLDTPIEEIKRVLEGSFIPYISLTQALFPLMTKGTHFFKLNGLLALHALPHVGALSVTAAAQLAWTRMLIAEAGENGPWITEFVIDSLVRTRALQSLPDGYLNGADIANEMLKIAKHENEHSIRFLGKDPSGSTEVETVPLPEQVPGRNISRLMKSFGDRG
ncbi:MAG: SDR family NAD(P)-dependent oxidoreductase [Chthoniobacter sp.]